MKMSRRGLFGAAAGAVVAGPSMAKEAASRMNVNSAPAGFGYGLKDSTTPTEDPSYYARRRAQLEREVRGEFEMDDHPGNNRHELGDPGFDRIDALRSVAQPVKRLMANDLQKRRNRERRMEYAAYELRDLLKRHGLRALLGSLLLVALLIPAHPVSAEDDGRWVRQSLRSSCEWWESCRYRYRPRHYYLPAVRVYGDRDDRYSHECRDFAVAVGEERYGRDRAKEAAEQSWMEEVRNRHGVKFMDLRNSRGGTWECGRSSTGNRASEKLADNAGRFLEQCTLRAKPCRAELERVNKD